MSDGKTARWALVWDDDGPSRPQLPVRNLDDELLPVVEMPPQKDTRHDRPEALRRRNIEYRRRLREKADELRRRPGMTKDTKHE